MWTRPDASRHPTRNFRTKSFAYLSPWTHSAELIPFFWYPRQPNRGTGDFSSDDTHFPRRTSFTRESADLNLHSATVYLSDTLFRLRRSVFPRIHFARSTLSTTAPFSNREWECPFKKLDNCEKACTFQKRHFFVSTRKEAISSKGFERFQIRLTTVIIRVDHPVNNGREKFLFNPLWNIQIELITAAEI